MEQAQEVANSDLCITFANNEQLLYFGILIIVLLIVEAILGKSSKIKSNSILEVLIPAIRKGTGQHKGEKK
jgi:hypothetical protein